MKVFHLVMEYNEETFGADIRRLVADIGEQISTHHVNYNEKLMNCMGNFNGLEKLLNFEWAIEEFNSVTLPGDIYDER